MSNQQCFQHSSFRQGNKDALRNIKRKTSAAEKQQMLMKQHYNELRNAVGGHL